jgi:hypothetical protein
VTTPEFWRAVEAVHAPVYFAPGAKQRYEQVGLKGFWMGYAASRSAALGTPSPQLVTATFHGFAPSMIARALPDAWRMAAREDVLEARYELARAALGPALDGMDVGRAARHLAEVVARADLAGRPLAAAHAALPAPDDDLGRLWHFATVLREYHGDSHVAVLVATGLNGATANALSEALGMVPPGQQGLRGWTEQDWDDAFEQLHMRGWVDADNVATEAGRAARERIEDTTHRVAAAGLDSEATARTVAVTGPLVAMARALEESGATAYPNPTGVPRP